MEENPHEAPPVLFVGNKVDLHNDRKVSREEGERVANQILYYRPQQNVKYIEASAKEDINITEVSSMLIRVSENKERNSRDDIKNKVTISEQMIYFF